jgi:hypothetical protein
MHLNSQIAARRLQRIKGRARANEDPSASPLLFLASTPPELDTATAVELPKKQVEGDRRGSDRVPTASNVVVRRIDGLHFLVGLRDISTRGCCIERIDHYEVGDPVIARLPEIEPLTSMVCWTEGVTAGLKFRKNIHPAVLDSLLARLPENATT